jgi:hypothetical protein
MAQYGYSTPYSGQQVAPLPPGYMEAATASGRNLAMGINAIGQGLGKALERYTENKKGHEALDETNAAVTKMYLQQMEADPKVQAVRYFEDTGQLPAGVDETTLKSYEAQMKRDATMISNLVGNSNKWADMSLAKKQAALGQTVTMLNQYRNNQQDDFKNQVTRQQLQKGRYELEDIISKRKQNEILSGAIQYGLDQPTTTTQMEEVTTEVPGAPLPPMPGENVPATQVPPTFNEQGYIEALRRYKETTTPEVNIADIKAQLAQLEPMASETPRQWQIPTLKGGMGGMSSAVDRATITETPQQIAGRIAEVIPKVRALRSQLESAQKQPLEMPRREQFLTQVDAQPSAMPAPLSAPLTVTRNVSKEVPVSYEDQSKRLTQYLLQQGAKPETLAMVPQILSMVGQQRPMQIESKTLPSGITVVRADGKVDILAAPKPIEGKPLNEAQGKAASFAAGMKLNNDTIKSVLDSKYVPKGLFEFGFMPERLRTDSRKSYETARKAWTENFLRDRSGAVISPEEYPATEEQYFPMAGDSEKIVKQKEAMRIDAMNNTMKKAGQHADDYVNQISNQPKSGVLKYNTATKRFE